MALDKSKLKKLLISKFFEKRPSTLSESIDNLVSVFEEYAKDASINGTPVTSIQFSALKSQLSSLPDQSPTSIQFETALSNGLTSSWMTATAIAGPAVGSVVTPPIYTGLIGSLSSPSESVDEIADKLSSLIDTSTKLGATLFVVPPPAPPIPGFIT